MLNFLKYRFVYAFISLAVIIPGMFFLLTSGLKPAIDFTGGSIAEIKADFCQKDRAADLQNLFSEKEIAVVDLSVRNGVCLFRMKTLESDKWTALKKDLAGRFSQFEEVRFETVGPILGQELLQKTFIAAFLAILGILTYVAITFRNFKYGLSAIIALFHDLIVVIGFFAFFGKFFQVEVDTLFVTAVLTTMSFSVHDTIVVFDRIRESVKSEKNQSFEFLVNKALTETMSRSLNNSMTIVFMLLALILLGGETIRWFTVALLIGTVSGTYSSPFVAAPVLVMLNKRFKS